MYNFLLVLFLLTIGFSCNMPNESSESRPDIIVDEDITKDTIWQGGKNYIITKKITVLKNVELILEGDIVIIFKYDSGNNNDALIEIDGKIEKLDNETVQFEVSQNSIDSESQKRCIVLNENAELNFINVSFKDFDIAISSNQYCKIKLDSCRFENCELGCWFSKSDSINIMKNIFNNNNISLRFELCGHGIYAPLISDCEFINDINTSIYLSNSSRIVIDKNIFNNSERAIFCQKKSFCNVNSNEFISCNIGCEIYHSAQMEIINNRFDQGRGTFILCDDTDDDTLVVRENYFLANNSYKVKMWEKSNNTVLDARYNWWNSCDESDIQDYILDKKDLNSTRTSGVVIYKPYHCLN